jgi:large conductance mechanosensitive channel
MTYAALKAAGVPMLGYGQFLTALVNFLILAFIIFLLVRAATRATRKAEDDAGPVEEVLLLREIRDSLKQRG